MSCAIATRTKQEESFLAGPGRGDRTVPDV